jgi:hypothetical protein
MIEREKARSMPGSITRALKYGVLFASFLIMNCFGIKQIHHYKRIKKQIHSVSNVIIVNMPQLKENKKKRKSEWDQVRSDHCDSFMTNKIEKYVQEYSRKDFVIRTVPFQTDPSLNSIMQYLFDGLEKAKRIETVRIDDGLLDALSSIDNPYILLIYQDGYCFSEGYLKQVDEAQAASSLFSAIRVVGFSPIGIGVLATGDFDRGYSRIGVALIDKSEGKVLYYSRRISRENPLGDSAIIYQLDPMLSAF